MSALYYSSQKLKKYQSTRTIISVFAVIAALGVGAAGGYYGNTKSQAAKTAQVQKAGKSYVVSILAGDLDKAYNESAPSLKKGQSKAVFTNNLKDLKASKAVFKNEVTSVSDKGISYAVVVNNLPPNKAGATDGVFTVNFTNESGWKVNKVIVQ